MEIDLSILWIVVQIATTLFIGWVVGRLVGKFVKVLAVRLKLDEQIERTYIGRRFKEAGVTLSSILDVLARIYVYAVAFDVAAGISGVPEVAEVTGRILGFMPYLIAGVIVALIGFVFSDFVVYLVMPRTAGFYPTFIRSITRVVLYLISILAGLTVMQIEVPILATVVTAFVWSIAVGLGVGLAVALGLGFKDAIAKRADRIIRAAGLEVASREEKLKIDRVRDTIRGLRDRIRELETERDEYKQRLSEIEEAVKLKVEELTTPTPNIEDRIRELVKGRGEVRSLYGGFEVEVKDLEHFPWCEVMLTLKTAGYEVIFTKRDDQYIILAK